MTAPHKQEPPCDHLQAVVVAEGTQVNLDGTVYTAGQTVEGVPNPLAEQWIAAGWAAPAAKTTKRK
ncbi:MAG TPA: hypothetical protein VMU34_16780 [Mycobacterium sp.]|nr:hypothetical protein [Mycobacterium sp.]